MIIMAADIVGYKIVKYLCDKNENIEVLVLDSKDRNQMNQNMIECVERNHCKPWILTYEELKDSTNMQKIRRLNISFGVLAWWPYIIKKEIIELTQRGFVNTHPAYLPYNRGKHPYIWNIVEQTPFGASIHWINEKIDSGAIIDREKIEVTWEDTGESLYYKACDLIIELFKRNYNDISNGSEKIIGNVNEQEGTFHNGSELKKIDKLDLDEEYKFRDILNILRSRMFKGEGHVCFEEDGKEYIVSVKLERKDELGMEHNYHVCGGG